MSIASEKARRSGLWDALANVDKGDIPPQQLRELGIYGGAQGIWVDKSNTADEEIGSDGATVAILHTGRHYADDVSDDGIIYHYPKTARPPSRDLAEIQATKNAQKHQLPIFVILPGKTSKGRRSLKMGWVCDYDDETRQFLILFGEDAPPPYEPAELPGEPFKLHDNAPLKTATVKARVGQQKFRFHVLQRYGHKCAVCDIRHPQLIKAAHICGKAEKGSDDWRNGLPLCSTHHDAFDAHFFSIEPETFKTICKPGVTPSEIGLSGEASFLSENKPHAEALVWRWKAAQQEWGVSAVSAA